MKIPGGICVVVGMVIGLLHAVPAALAEGEDGMLVVLNKAEASASLLDRVTGREIARLETGHGPHEVAVSADGRTAVVANYGGRAEPGSSLTVIDLAARSVRRTIDLGLPHRPHGILFLSDGKRVVVTAEARQTLIVVDVDAGRILTTVDTTQRVSHMVAVTPDERRAFVANIASGSVSVIDLERGELEKVIATGEGAEGIDVAPDGREVWVSNRSADTISVIDVATLEIVATIECPSFPIRVKFTPDGRHVLASNARSGDVAVFDTAERTLVRRIEMKAAPVDSDGDRVFGGRFGASPVPVGILIPPDGRVAYVANTNADQVTVIDLQTWEIAGRLTAGREPDGMAYTTLAPPRVPPGVSSGRSRSGASPGAGR